MEPYGQAKVFFIAQRVPINLIFDVLPAGIAMLDRRGRIIDVNDRFRSIPGMEEREVVGRSVVSLFSPGEGSEALEEALHGTEEGHQSACEIRTGTDGEDTIFRATIVPTVFTDGTTGTVLIFEDVTMQKWQEERLIAQRDLALVLSSAETLHEAMPVCVETAIRISGMESGGIYVVDRQTGAFRLVHSTGVTKRLIRNFSIIEVDTDLGRMIQNGLPVYWEGATDERKGGIFTALEAELTSYAILPVQNRGSVIACFTMGSPTRGVIRPESRRSLEMIAASIGNAIARILARDEIQENEEKYRMLFNNLDDAIFLHLIDSTGPGRIIEVNDTTCERLGYTREDLLTMTPLEINDPDYPGNLPGIMSRLLREGHVLFRWAHMTRTGERIPVEINAHLFTFRGEQVVLSIVRDLRQCEERG
nr:PAS domain S-box protein [Methanofollis fontis]